MVENKLPTEEELQILEDQKFLLLKESVSQKTIKYLAEIEQSLKEPIRKSSFAFPSNALTKSGKISKGENYLGLPYFILDCPRLFTKKEVFAFRTMLWWGHEFSCTLHIGGEQIKRIDDKFLLQLKREGISNDSYFCISKSPWDYHFESSNYVPTSQLNLGEMKNHIRENDFIKISRFIPVNQWAMFKSFTLESFARFLILLG